MKRIIVFPLATVLFAVPALAIRAVDVQEGMNNEEFKALLSLLMETDGTGFSDNDRQTLLDYANRKSRELGYYDWIGAYHGL